MEILAHRETPQKQALIKILAFWGVIGRDMDDFKISARIWRVIVNLDFEKGQ